MSVHNPSVQAVGIQCGVENACEFRRWIRTLAHLVSEAVLEFNNEGFRIRQLSADHVSLTHLKLPVSYFQWWRNDIPCQVLVWMNSFLRALRFAEEGDSLGMRKSLSGDELCLELQGSKTCKFQLELKSPREPLLSIPDLNYSIEVSIRTASLLKSLILLHGLGECVTIHCSARGLTLETWSTYPLQIKRSQVIYSPGTGVNNVQVHEAYDSISQTMSCGHLIKFLQSSKSSPVTLLSFLRNQPIRLQWAISPASRGVLEYYLAPKIEDE